MSLWIALVVVTAGSYGLKLAGVSLPERALAHPRIQRIASILPVAMLTALVVVGLFEANGRYHADGPLLAGVGASALALRWRATLPVALVVAVVVTGSLRAIL